MLLPSRPLVPRPSTAAPCCAGAHGRPCRPAKSRCSGSARSLRDRLPTRSCLSPGHKCAQPKAQVRPAPVASRSQTIQSVKPPCPPFPERPQRARTTTTTGDGTARDRRCRTATAEQGVLILPARKPSRPAVHSLHGTASWVRPPPPLSVRSHRLPCLSCPTGSSTSPECSSGSSVGLPGER